MIPEPSLSASVAVPRLFPISCAQIVPKKCRIRTRAGAVAATSWSGLMVFPRRVLPAAGERSPGRSGDRRRRGGDLAGGTSPGRSPTSALLPGVGGLALSLPYLVRRVDEIESSCQDGPVELVTADVVGETRKVRDPPLGVFWVGDHEAVDRHNGCPAGAGCALLLPRPMPAGRGAKLGKGSASPDGHGPPHHSHATCCPAGERLWRAKGDGFADRRISRGGGRGIDGRQGRSEIDSLRWLERSERSL